MLGRLLPLLRLLLLPTVSGRPPNIVLVLADDLGWGDVGWNNPRMEDVTPHLSRLARSGVILSQYYVQQVCTPSRAALMTGLYPFHTGRQKGTIKPLQPTGLSLDHSLLSEQLSQLGYRTHAVGKWHLGFCRAAYTPTRRGFDSFYGYYTGAEHYYSHVRDHGFDFRRDDAVEWAAKGNYSTDLFTEEAVKIVRHHNAKQPLFLYLPYQATHAPLEAPLEEVRRVGQGDSGSPERGVYRAMLARMDAGVGRVVEALRAAGQWDNTLLLFSTDNGGAVSMAGSNHPLRGTKGTLFEGGTRGAAFLAGGAVAGRGETSRQLLHITDWLPTLLAVAGGRAGPGLDGRDQSAVVRQPRGASKRTEVVYNLKVKPMSGAIRMGDYKLMFAPQFNKDGWYDPDSSVRAGRERRVVRRRRRKGTGRTGRVRRMVGQDSKVEEKQVGVKDEDENDAHDQRDIGKVRKTIVTTTTTMKPTVTTTTKKATTTVTTLRSMQKKKRVQKKKIRSSTKLGKTTVEPVALKTTTDNEVEATTKINKTKKNRMGGTKKPKKKKDKNKISKRNGISVSSKNQIVKEKKKQGHRNNNIKETKSGRASVKNLRVIGRRYNIRPSVSKFYGVDRDWSDKARNTSEPSPVDVFDKMWPKLKKHLFNVRTDPEERFDLMVTKPEVVERLRKRVVELLRTFVPRDYPAPSSKGRPSRFNNVWSPGWC